MMHDFFVIVPALLLVIATGWRGSVEAAPNVHYRKARAVGELRSRADCPVVWEKIAAELKSNFNGCNRNARSSIRFAFHDAGGYSKLNTPYEPASGGADGSLLLNDEELARGPNAIMTDLRNSVLLPMYNKYKDQGIGAADFVQFAGALAVKTCPGGPSYKTVVGRQDNNAACPEGNLPPAFGVNSTHAVITQMFADKGFSERDMAALIGAHSVSKSFSQASNGIPEGGPQDTTPTTFDMEYYKQTQATNPPEGVYRFDSDVNMAQNDTLSGQAFTEFGNSYETWAAAYADAAYRLSVAGIDPQIAAGFIDCSHFVV